MIKICLIDVRFVNSAFDNSRVIFYTHKTKLCFAFLGGFRIRISQNEKKDPDPFKKTWMPNPVIIMLGMFLVFLDPSILVASSARFYTI